MRAATIVLAVTLASAALPARAQDIQGIFDELRRVLTPDEERGRTERRERYDDYQRRDERGADGDYPSSDRREETDTDRRDGEGTRYGERYNPSDDRFWSEEARRVGYQEMGEEERRRYDGLGGRERDRFDEEAGFERKRRYERMSESERRRYDESLEEMYAEIRRGRSRG